MCTPSVLQAGGSVIGLQNKNKKEAQVRQRDAAVAEEQRKGAVRKKNRATQKSRRTTNIQRFSANVAAGGQRRSASTGS